MTAKRNPINPSIPRDGADHPEGRDEPEHHVAPRLPAPWGLPAGGEVLRPCCLRLSSLPTWAPQVLDPKEQQIQSLTPTREGQDFILGDPTAQVA